MSIFYDQWALAGSIRGNALDFAADALAALKGEITHSAKQEIKDELDAAMRKAGASTEERSVAQMEIERLAVLQGGERAAERKTLTLTTIALVIGIVAAVLVVSIQLKRI